MGYQPTADLAHSVRVAAEILQRVSVQIREPPGLAAAVVRQASELDGFLPALDSIREEAGHPAWNLDQAWVDTAFAVAASRPRVLLTLATNAVAALSAQFDDALEETLSPRVEAILLEQREGVRGVQARLADARLVYLAPTEGASGR